MSLVDVPVQFLPPTSGIIANTTTTVFTFDTSTDVLAAVFQIPKTGTIDNIHYRINANTAANMTLRTELRTVNTTTGIYNAAGTLYGSSTSITTTTLTAATNFTAAVACTGATKGDLAALVFDLSAFTSGSFTMLERLGAIILADQTNNRVSAFPYAIRNTAGSDVLSTLPIGGFLLEYSGGVFVPAYPLLSHFCGAVANSTITNSGTTRRGNKYTIPVACRSTGIYVYADIDGAVSLTVRDSGGTLLGTVTVDKDLRGAVTPCLSFFQYDSGATVTHAAGDVVYIGMEGTDATGGILYRADSAPSNAALGATVGGLNCHSFTYAGSYSDVTTSQSAIGLIIDQLDDGTGGGGGGVIGVIGG